MVLNMKEPVREPPEGPEPPDYFSVHLRDWKSDADNGVVVVFDRNEDEGFDECELSFEDFLRKTPSSLVQRKTIAIQYLGSFDAQFEEVCKIVRNIPRLKALKLSATGNGRSGTWAGAVSRLLLEMSTLRKFTLNIPWPDGLQTKLLVDSLLQIQSLQAFNLIVLRHSWPPFPAMKQLCRYLKVPTNILARLEIHSARLDDEEVRLLASVLGDNKFLKYLSFCRVKRKTSTFLPPSGVGSIAEALLSNTTLKTLVIWCTYIWAIEMKKLVAAIIPDSSGCQPNTSLSDLNLDGSEVEAQNGVVEYLSTMIKCNTSLKRFSVGDWEELKEGGCDRALHNVLNLLKSLQSNRTLEYLCLHHNTRIGGKQVLGMIMDMLLHNRTIVNIYLEGTPLDKEGDAEFVYAELRKRKRDYELWLSVANMPPVKPNSARIFLCGNGEAGKTTICQKWEVMEPQERKQRRHIIGNLFSKYRQQVSTSKHGDGLSSKDTDHRTRGIEVHKLVWGSMNISIWDMAGQEEYHSFHDLVVPNDSATGNCCLYFIVCNPVNRPLDAILTEIHYWLKFVASNTRKSESYRPHVTILMTHFDLWRGELHLSNRLKDRITELKIVFKDHLNFDDKLPFFSMDNGPGFSNDAFQLKQFAEKYLTTLSTNVPKVLKATIELQSIVAKWNAEHRDQPFIDWKTFEKICEGVDELKPSIHINEALLNKKKIFVATALHEGGHILYYQDLKRIIMNPQWFCHDIMGTILFKCSTLNPNYSMISNGIIPQNYLEEVYYESLDSRVSSKYFEDFLSIMMKLQICYKDTDGNILFPSLFKSVQAIHLFWPSRKFEDNSSFSYFGSRLASKEPTATMLTTGFFPRLQVFLQKFVLGVARRSYKILKDSISFTYRHSDVYIEYKNDCIDIMSRSSGPEGYELHLQIIKSINDLRSSAILGCSGVDFEEFILRPYCVQELSPYEVRWNQVVSKRELKKMVTSLCDLNYQHHWEENDSSGLPGGFDSAETLLPQVDWQDVLQSCSQKLNVVETALEPEMPTVASSSEAEDVFPDDLVDLVAPSPEDSSEYHLKKYLQKEFQSLHMKLDQNHDEVKEILKGLKQEIIHKQELLYSRVSSRMSNLMKFSVQLLQSRVPKYPIFVPDSSRRNMKQVLKRMIPGLTSGRLYFFCEHKAGFHLPHRQVGLDASYGTASTRTFGIVLFWGLSVVTLLLKVGAHLGAGMGEVIPYPLLKDFMIVLDSPGLLDMAKPSGPVLEFLPDDLKKSPTISSFDNQVAEDWLVDFIKSKCNTVSSIHEKLGLNKVVYLNHSHESTKSNPVVAWVCDEHMESGRRDGTLECIGNSFVI
ncbi:hypothetical protein M758_10G174400 [Ceratodon purpureus]|nr:hypothetical protein M758_10G174400 [Ceratodon purpureus]